MQDAESTMELWMTGAVFLHKLPLFFMDSTIWAILTVFGLGVVYFLAAIPAGVALHLSPTVAAISAWAGYTAIGAMMLLIGTPARRWVQQRLKLPTEPDTRKLFWRVWLRWGMPGLGLLAPVTCGPYFAALIALALGERPGRVILWIAGGAVPWCIIFGFMAAFGWKLASH
jgi:Putative small multi-drug export protein